MSALLGLGLEWARPGAAAALLLTPLYLWLARLRARPREVVIGTLHLLPAGAEAAGARHRRRPPPAAWLAALALLCGAVAWIGPRPARVAGARRWTCVLDRTPSMFLARSDASPETRLAAALAAARGLLAAEAGAEERVRWLSPGRPALDLARDEAPPPDWLAASPARAPDWELFDAPGTLWITDRAPAAVRVHAGLAASGGAARPGPIAADGRSSLSWDGATLALGPGLARGLALEGELPAVVQRVARAWGDARGFELGPGTSGGADVALVLARAGTGPLVGVRVARDGWSATGRAAAGGLAPSTDEGEAEDWLLGRSPQGERIALVRARAGRIELALAELSEPAGDPALFALSWGALLDRWAAPAPEVVPLAERRAAGEPELAAPLAPRTEDEGGDARAESYGEAALSLAAALLSLLAVLVGRRS